MIIVCNKVGSITIARRSLNLIACAFCSFSLFTSGGEVNVYSARHYDTDILMYEEFTSQTGHRINLIEGGSDALIERIAIEGEYSPADILITVDAGRLWRAKERGIFRSKNGGKTWKKISDFISRNHSRVYVFCNCCCRFCYSRIF